MGLSYSSACSQYFLTYAKLPKTNKSDQSNELKFVAIVVVMALKHKMNTDYFYGKNFPPKLKL